MGGSPVARVPRFQTQREIAEEKAKQTAEQKVKEKALKHIAQLGISLELDGFISKDLSEATEKAREMVQTNNPLMKAAYNKEYGLQKSKVYKKELNKAYSKERKRAAATALAQQALALENPKLEPTDAEVEEKAREIFSSKDEYNREALKIYQEKENRMNEKNRKSNEKEREKAIRRGNFSFANPNLLGTAVAAGERTYTPSISKLQKSKNNEFEF